MYNLGKHPYFEKWVDPTSGIESFILKERVAPVQQSFYFVNSSVSPDEKWLWFYTAFPPARYKTLGVVSLDPLNPIIHIFPHAVVDGALPMITPDSKGAYFGINASASIWRIDLDGNTEEVCRLSDKYINHRRVNLLATHLTLSADGKYLLLDGQIGNIWFVGLGDLKTGKVKILHEFGRCHNHAQFSPVDHKLFMIPQDWWRDANTGHYMILDQRIWLMDTDCTRFEPLLHEWFGHGSAATHEWWSKDGMVCWIDYEKGAFECDVVKRQPVNVWPGPLCHGHCDSTRRYWCADQNPYNWDKKPCEVRFYDRETKKEVHIVTALPKPPVPRDWYHLDPHPQFSPKDTWVVYTTTVQGSVDVALVPVQNIV